MSAKKRFKIASGILLLALGAWLIFYELAMAVSESHALHGANIVLFACYLLAGFFIAFSGYRLLRPSRTRGRMHARNGV